MLRALCVIVFALGIGSGRGADAGNPKERALSLFAESDIAYKNGHFERAAELLREAYALEPEPILLYNLARALEGMGELRGAIEAYEGYLAAGVKIEDRGAIERRVATLREQEAAKAAIAKQAEAQKLREASRPALVPAKPAGSTETSAWPWVVIGAGGAMLAGGGVFGVLARAAHDDAVAEPEQVRASTLDDTAHRRARFANVMFVAGGLVVVTGAIWKVIDGRSTRAANRERAAVGVAFGPSSIGITGTW